MIRQLSENFAQGFGRTAKIGLVVGALAILFIMGIVGYWFLRPDYQVLFADLSPQDTVAMTAELDRQKIPFVLSDQGNNTTTILVDKSEVYKTRIKLMGKEIPLHGAVGFELFNNSDFGMTEFAQKINYQRALQGELTRTILALAEIRDARVLLALPEQSLFKQASNKPKASITVTMKQDQRLHADQVTGIQRLVAAAVPGILASDVTIVDQSGVALTRPAGDGDGDLGSGSYRLDVKKEMEAYLSRKAGLVLERALGPGQGMASVDVILDMDKVQTNTDEILSTPTRGDETPTGVIVRDRQTSRESEQPSNRTHAENSGNSPGGSNQSEVEYAVGHRVEQVISQPGSVRRIQVAVVVNKPLNTEQQEQLRAMVAASVGASTDRGDLVVIQNFETLNSNVAPQISQDSGDPGAMNMAIPRHSTTSESISSEYSWKGYVAPGIAFFLLLVFGGLFFVRGRPNSTNGNTSAMTETQRQAALAQVRSWMEGHQRSESPSISQGIRRHPNAAEVS